MSRDPNDIPPENQASCFSEFLIASVDQDPAFDSFNFNNISGTSPDMGSRYPAASAPQNGIGNINVTHQQAEVKQLIEDENVFGNEQDFYNQGIIHTPFVPYSTCHDSTQRNHQQIMQYSNNNGQNMVVQNYGYMHTSSPDSGDRASISNSPYTPTVRQDFPVSPPSAVSQQPQKMGSIPSMSDYSGDNNFEIYFGASTESAVKSAQFTHSVLLGKLFVKMNVLCPIQFRCLKQPPEGSVIRALPVYTRPEHVTEVVTRCPNHQIQDSSVDFLARHLIRAEQPGNNSVQYGMSPDGRASVLVAYIPPETGSEYVTIFYKYMCLSSCVGGINRRPIMTVFTLESPDGTVLGRRCVEVRICSCPGRDRSQEERKKRKPPVPPGYVLLPKKKKPGSMPSTSTAVPESNDGDEFFLRVKGKEKYTILKKLKEALDLMEYIPQERREEYQQQEAQADADTSSMTHILSNYFKQARGGDGSSPT